jgi:2-octaprenyl-6-methoxyphenol hydroxylase
VRLLEALEVWPTIAPLAAPMLTMQLIDDTGSLFRPPPASFHASEIDLDASAGMLRTPPSSRALPQPRALTRSSPPSRRRPKPSRSGRTIS